jgi:hypothetical protein
LGRAAATRPSKPILLIVSRQERADSHEDDIEGDRWQFGFLSSVMAH